MTNEIRNAIKKGINDSELNGYKWTITKDGLKWSYGEQFTFYHKQIDDEDGHLFVLAKRSEMSMASILIGESFYHDCQTIEEAYYLATKRTIWNANHTY